MAVASQAMKHWILIVSDKSDDWFLEKLKTYIYVRRDATIKVY